MTRAMTAAIVRSQSAPVNSLSASNNVRRQSVLQSFGLRKKSEIDIVLDGGDDFIHTYSTFDEIKGHVVMRFDKDTPIQDLNIVFQGQTDVWLETMTAMTPRSGRSTARHIFLRVQQPIDSTIFGQSNVAKAGVSYTLPFTFVVPDRLLPFVCKHTVDNENVTNQHLQLPPSIGDDMLAGEGQVLMNDLAPAMSKIVYTVRVRIAKASVSKQEEVITESVKVRIIPTQEERPPAPTDKGLDHCLKYALRKEKTIRGGLFRIGKKQGHLVAETTQPRCLRTPHPQQQKKQPAGSMTSIRLRFDPASAGEQPPQLNSIATKLRSFTYFGAAPYRYLPEPNLFDVHAVMHGQYPDAVDLSTMNLTSVVWTKHEPGSSSVPKPSTSRSLSRAPTSSSTSSTGRKPSVSATKTNLSSEGSPTSSSPPYTTFPSMMRRTSNSSDDSDASSSDETSETSSFCRTSSNPYGEPTSVAPSAAYNSQLPFYTTSVLVPITLPSHSSSSKSFTLPSPDLPAPNLKSRKTTVTFLPSFHSCLVSRAYALEFVISPNGKSVPNITLRTPIQVAPEANPLQSTNRHPSHLSAPIEFYDPFTLSDDNADATDIFNDEAIARALANSYSYGSGRPQGLQAEMIPEYQELQIQNTIPPTNGYRQSSPSARAVRFNSLPQVPLHDSTGHTDFSNSMAQQSSDGLPGYYAGYHTSTPR